MISNVNKKTKEELLEEFSNNTSHNTLEGEQYTAAILVKSAADIESSTKNIKQAVDQFKDVAEKMRKSSDLLSNKLFWLNVVLALATTVGAIATVTSAFK